MTLQYFQWASFIFFTQKKKVFSIEKVLKRFLNITVCIILIFWSCTFLWWNLKGFINMKPSFGTNSIPSCFTKYLNQPWAWKNKICSVNFDKNYVKPWFEIIFLILKITLKNLRNFITMLPRKRWKRTDILKFTTFSCSWTFYAKMHPRYYNQILIQGLDTSISNQYDILSAYSLSLNSLSSLHITRNFNEHLFLNKWILMFFKKFYRIYKGDFSLNRIGM